MSVHAAVRLNSEPNLIAQARDGDTNAFAVLYETHKPRVQAVCLRMTDNVAEAEDLVQDAFIYVFRKISTFRGDSAFSTWIHRVTVNAVLMHFRKKGKRQVSLEQPNPQDLDGPKYEYGRVDERLAACADRLALVRAIEELPSGYRTIFLLHEVQGYEHKEIARRLHCSIGNSKSQLHKAKLYLRAVLSPRGYAYRHKVAVTKRALRVPIEVANISGPLQPSIGALPGPVNQLLASDAPGRMDAVPMQAGGVSLAPYEKQRRRGKKLPDLSVVSNPQIILPPIWRGSAGMMAESGS